MLTTRNTGPSSGRGSWAATLAAITMLLVAGCSPPGPKALLDGERLLNEGKPDEALRRLRTAVEFLPNQAQAWNHLGLALHASRQATQAAEAYQRALDLDRNLAAAHFNLGCLFQEQGDMARAADSFGTFVQLHPRAVEGWVRLGQVQLKARRWDFAEKSFQTALRQLPGDPEALNGLGVALQQRRKYSEAWGCFTNVVSRHPDFAPAWLNLAVAAHQSGLKSFAAQSYRYYANLRPEAARDMGVVAVADQLEALLRPPVTLPPAASGSHGPTNAVVEAVPSRTNLNVVSGVGTTAKPTNAASPVMASAPRKDATNVASGTGGPSAASNRLAIASVAAPPSTNVPAKSQTSESSAGGGGLVLTGTDSKPNPAVVPQLPREVTPTPKSLAESSNLAIRPAASTTLVALASTTSTRPSASPTSAPPSRVTPPTTVVASTSAPSPSVASAVPKPPAIPSAGPSNGVPSSVQTATVVPLTNSVSTSMSKPATSNAPPLEVVRITPPPQVTAEVHDVAVKDDVGRDGTPAVPTAMAATPSGPESGGNGDRPLVRPVSRARPGGPADEKSGFWSRANPVRWFGDEAGKDKEETGVSSEEDLSESGDASGRWKWANPVRWFGSEKPGDEAHSPAVAGNGPPRVTPVARGTNVPVTPPRQMASLGTEGGARTNRTPPDVVAATRKANAAFVEKPPAVSNVSQEPAKEVRRYRYQNLATPRTGEVAAGREEVSLGVQEHRRDRLDLAVRHYEAALAKDPSSFEASYNLALARLQRGEVTEALNASEQALAVDPDSAAARFTLALALDRAGYPVDAAAEAERVVRRRSDDAAGHLLLGNLYAQRLGDPVRAKSHYVRVIELQPDHPQSVAIRNWLADHR